MDVNFTFANSAQKEAYYAIARNQCFSGGFNNGKTYEGCFKAFTLLTSFVNYRMAICRQVYTDLKRTTMQTFFKMCPSGLIDTHNQQDGITVLRNSSTIYWMHLDKVDEKSLKGLEVNSVLVDQAEETEEKIYDVLDARIGRWDGAIPNDNLLAANPNWPRNPMTGAYIVPSYMMLLTNPDTQFHYIYRKYHPDSLERNKKYFYVSGEWDKNLGSLESYASALERDPEWIEKYVKGGWGLSSAALHFVSPECILEPIDELVERVLTKGNLFRVMDHGDSAPTCCLWFAALDGIFVCYREYYVPNRTIKYHRQGISDFSGDEMYAGNYADPQIFKKTAQKDGGFWSVSDEYRTNDLDAPPLHWLKADNNEFATRNRINELLQGATRYRHPISKTQPAPGIYFIKKSANYPYGCDNAIKQLGSQRKMLLGTIDGKSVYSDDRDENIVDHAYDCIRYFVAMHGTSPRKAEKRPARNSFAYYEALKIARASGQIFLPGSVM